MDPDDYLLPLVSLILVILTIVWAIWYYYAQRGTNITVNGSSFYCPVGQCSTNVFSGEKQCPDDSSQQVQYQPGLEVCNPPNFCTSLSTPYALQENFGTTVDGVCANGECQCLSQNQCPEYITSYFTADEGRPFQPLTSSRLAIYQRSSFVDKAGYVQNEPPFSFTFDGLQFCAIPLQWVPRLYPRRCRSGTLAFLSADPSQVDLSNVQNLPLSCVQGTNCGILGTAIWDTVNNKLVCKALCPSGEQPRWSSSLGRAVCTAVDVDALTIDPTIE